MAETTADTALDDEDDRLPWLEPIEEEDRGPSAGKLIGAVLVGLVAIGIVVGGLFWLGSRAGGGNPKEEVIASPGDYKMPAPDKGGMKVDDKGTTQVATSEGKEPPATINKDARPETPVGEPTQNAPTNTQQPAAQRPAEGQRTAQPAQQAQPRLTGPTIQLGAYSSDAVANSEWARLSQRFPQLRGLQHAVTTTQRDGRTYYRLRAAGAEAHAACRRIQAARTPCTIVNS